MRAHVNFKLLKKCAVKLINLLNKFNSSFELIYKKFDKFINENE
jgi:hypothetical protein